MPQFSFGQPVGGICQLSYIVEDMQRAMEKFTRTLHAGPWFLMEGAQLAATYRGQPTQFRGSLAFGNAGHMMIELVHQSDDTPSVFTEVIEKRGYGLHHQAVAVRDFDAQIEAYKKLGYEMVFYCATNHRSAYLDTHGDFPFFVEVIEITEPVEAIFAAVHRASIDWNGQDPVRDIGQVTQTVQAKPHG